MARKGRTDKPGKEGASATPGPGKPLNRSLSAAKAAKQDELCTQYVDIQKEVEAYLEYDPKTFKNKIVYCNCDDPFESDFFKYFAANVNKLGLKRLICTSYDGSPLAGQMTLFDEYNAGNGHRTKPKAIAVIVDHVKDENNDGAADIEDVILFLKPNSCAIGRPTNLLGNGKIRMTATKLPRRSPNGIQVFQRGREGCGAALR